MNVDSEYLGHGVGGIDSHEGTEGVRAGMSSVLAPVAGAQWAAVTGAGGHGWQAVSQEEGNRGERRDRD